MPTGIYQRTEEHNRKNSESHIGIQAKEKHPFWDKHHSEESKKKMGEAHKGKVTWWLGRHHSEESRRKMSEVHKGNHHSEKSKKKMGEAHKGEKSYNWKRDLSGEKSPSWGKHRSEESRKNMSKAHIGIQAKEKHPLWGKHHSEESRRKMSETHKNKKGDKSSNWKGGITPLALQIRHSNKYKEWHQRIFIRDDFTCQKCHIKGGNLEAHHKKSFSKLIKEVKKYLPLFSLYDGAMIYTPLWDINNGITYCEKCHSRRK